MQPDGILERIEAKVDAIAADVTAIRAKLFPETIGVVFGPPKTESLNEVIILGEKEKEK